MFSVGSKQAHAKRRRILASAYSKTAVSHFHVQSIIKTRTVKLLRFVEGQVSVENSSFGKTGPFVVRNLFRALQSDIFTAFAFSEKSGTAFLDRLRSGANTMEDLGMEMMDLCHDERRESFFFWESETPFKYIGRFVDRKGPIAHAKAQRWVSELIAKYEAALQRGEKGTLDESFSGFNSSPYKKMLTWQNPDTGQFMDWNERASEILDHCGSTLTTASTFRRLLTYAYSGRTRRRASRSRVHDPNSECASRSPVQITRRTVDLGSFGRRRSKFCYGR